MVRVSTEAQQTEDQHREMELFCKEEGYDELIFVEDKGASAIKLNDQYRLMIWQVKNEIEKDPDIKCFAVWEMSRAFRNEGVYYEVKTFLLERGIQFLVKNPRMRLLNPDGTLNQGMELAMSIQMTMSKQEMELKKERFHRAKKAMWEQGKYIGGAYVKYGYKVGDGGYFVVDEEPAQVIRLMYEMYSTGKWSSRTLYEELNDRGYKLTYHRIIRCLADKSYVNGIYPPIISKELWEKCENVRKRNMLSIPKGKNYHFGGGIFKCSVCGRSMVAEGVQYRCWHHNKFSAPPHCDNGLTIRVDNLDGLLWWIASKEEIQYRMKMDSNKRGDFEKQINVLKEKVENYQKKLDFIEEKKRRIVETYMDGLISKEEREKRLNKTLSEVKVYNDTISKFNEQIDGFLTILEGNEDGKVSEEKLRSTYLGVISEVDLKMMKEIVNKHIVRVTTSPEWFGKDRDMRAVRQNAQLVTVETMFSGVKKFIYVARKYKGHRFWWYTNDGKERPVLTVKPIKRAPLGKKHPRAFKKMKDW